MLNWLWRWLDQWEDNCRAYNESIGYRPEDDETEGNWPLNFPRSGGAGGM